MKLTPEKWCLRTGIRIMDPDGWPRRSPDFDKLWATPITRDEFLVRARSSTCMAWPTPLYDEKWRDEERLHPDYDDCLCKDPWEHGKALTDNTLPKEPAVSKNPEPVVPKTPDLGEIVGDLLNILAPKPAAPGINPNELFEAAKQLKVMFDTFVKAGFTEPQALELVGRMLKS